MSPRLQRAVPLHRTTEFQSLVSLWRDRTAVACSGGIDSTALLILAAHARDRQRIAAFVCAYVDHLTRSDSDKTADMVARTCRALAVPFIRVVVAEYDASADGAPEDVLRTARYTALGKACADLGFDAVATGHTLDDQVETILMRLLTGAGPNSMAGMQPVQRLTFGKTSVTVVRPLLDARRCELEAIVSFHGAAHFFDPSNDDVSIPRNRLRGNVIPELERAFPGFQTAIVRSVGLVRLDAQFLDELAEHERDSVAEPTDRGYKLDRGWVRRNHPALTRRVIRSVVLSAISGLGRDVGRDITYERIDSVRNAAAGRTGATIELPGGVTAIVRTSTIDIERESRAGNDT